jgi:hypothetical protein
MCVATFYCFAIRADHIIIEEYILTFGAEAQPVKSQIFRENYNHGLIMCKESSFSGLLE